MDHQQQHGGRPKTYSKRLDGLKFFGAVDGQGRHVESFALLQSTVQFVDFQQPNGRDDARQVKKDARAKPSGEQKKSELMMQIKDLYAKKLH